MPVFLKVLCILSFIFIGINLISGITGLFRGPMSEVKLNEAVEASVNFIPKGITKAQTSEAAELIYQKLKIKNDKTYLDSTVTIWIYSLGFFGVFKIYKKRQKGGFYLYLVYSILSVFTIYLIYPIEIISMEDLLILFLWSGLMVSLYSINLKHLTK